VYICSKITERGLLYKDRILQNFYHRGNAMSKINIEDSDYLNPDSCQFKGYLKLDTVLN